MLTFDIFVFVETATENNDKGRETAARVHAAKRLSKKLLFSPRYRSFADSRSRFGIW